METSDKVRLYLAHPLASRHEVRELELQLEEDLGIDLLNPFYDRDGMARGDVARIDAGEITPYDLHLSPKAIVEGDLASIDECDGVLALITSEATIGVWMELFYAKENYIPVLLVSDDERIRQHPWVRYCCSEEYIFTHISDFKEFWRASRGPSRNSGIGLVGKKRSGKDTVGKYLVSQYSYKRFAFADEVRFLCGRLFGFSRDEVETKPPHVRQVLQAFGTEYARSIFPTVLIDVVLRRIDRHRRVDPDGYRNIVITDVRFENEVEQLRKRDFVIAKLERGGDTADVHASETALENISPDFRLDNTSSIPGLFTRVDRMLRVVEQKRRWS